MSEVLPEFYVVEKIYDKKFVHGKPHYFVKWENYPESENTWEPLVNLENVLYLVKEFEDTHKNLCSSPTKVKSKGKGVQNRAGKRLPSKSIIKYAILVRKKRFSMVAEDSVNDPGSENDDEFILNNQTFNKDGKSKGELRRKRGKESEACRSELHQDAPNLVIKSAVHDRERRELEFLVDWKRRLNGVKPEPSWMTSQNLKALAPELLCDYLLKHVKFPDNPKPENIL